MEIKNSPVSPATSVEPIRFTGNANDFFGIWFVNKLLIIVTLGIYSAWAKVRELRYFYNNTELADSQFDFTAEPTKVLRSRIIAFALFAVFILVGELQSTAALVAYFGIVTAYILLAPVLTVFVMSFKLRYSAWRGINFRFIPDFKGAYRVYLPPTLLTFALLGSFYLPFNSLEVEQYLGIDRHQQHLEFEHLESDDAQTAETTDPDSHVIDNHAQTDLEANEEDIISEEDAEGDHYWNPYFLIPCGLLSLLLLGLLPYFDFINQRFLARNVRIGTSKVTYTSQIKDYYVIYWRWILATALLVSLWLLITATDHLSFSDFGWPMVVATLVYFPLSRAYLKAKRYNLFYGNLSIDDGSYRVRCEIPFLKLFYILVTNTLLVSMTFGLMTPWARVRTAKFLLSHMQLETNRSLDQFTAEQQGETSAIGEELADAFDIDVGI